MNPEQKSKWLEQIDKTISKKEITIEQTRQARNSADSPMTSRYDTQRDIFNNDLNILLDGLEADMKLREELKVAGECNSVESGAYLDLAFGDDTENYLYMNNFGTLYGIDIITPQSPIGKAIQGKKAGDSAEYKVEEKSFRVDIKKIQ